MDIDLYIKLRKFNSTTINVFLYSTVLLYPTWRATYKCVPLRMEMWPFKYCNNVLLGKIMHKHPFPRLQQKFPLQLESTDEHRFCIDTEKIFLESKPQLSAYNSILSI